MQSIILSTVGTDNTGRGECEYTGQGVDLRGTEQVIQPHSSLSSSFIPIHPSIHPSFWRFLGMNFLCASSQPHRQTEGICTVVVYLRRSIPLELGRLWVGGWRGQLRSATSRRLDGRTDGRTDSISWEEMEWPAN